MSDEPKVESTDEDKDEEESNNSGGTVLRPERLLDAGMNALIENPNIDTGFHLLTNDADFKSIYPSFQIVGNIARETCKFAVKQIVGKKLPNVLDDGDYVRDIFAHVIDIKGNCIYLANTYFGLPNYSEMKKIIDSKIVC